MIKNVVYEHHVSFSSGLATSFSPQGRRELLKAQGQNYKTTGLLQASEQMIFPITAFQSISCSQLSRFRFPNLTSLSPSFSFALTLYILRQVLRRERDL